METGSIWQTLCAIPGTACSKKVFCGGAHRPAGHGRDGAVPGPGGADTLSEGTAHGIIGSERMMAKYGQGVRQKSKSDFIRRSVQKVRGRREGRNVIFGQPVESGISGSAGSIQEELTAPGVPGFLAGGPAGRNRDGPAKSRQSQGASALSKGAAFIHGWEYRFQN